MPFQKKGIFSGLPAKGKISKCNLQIHARRNAKNFEKKSSEPRNVNRLLILKKYRGRRLPKSKSRRNFRATKKKTTGKPLQTGDHLFELFKTDRLGQIFDKTGGFAFDGIRLGAFNL
jgi:hypothetical protein